MSVSKIKTIMIAALVFVNLLFISVIANDWLSDRNYAQQAVENACYVLVENGIEISADDIKKGAGLKSMKTAREAAAERRIAEAVLGTVTMSEQGGAINRFENGENGEAVFYSGGEFNITIRDNVIKNEQGTQETVKKLVRSMNLEAGGLYLSGRLGLETVTAVCAYKKSGIFNCTIRFVFSGGSLISVSGRCVTGIEPLENGSEGSLAATALMSFMSAVKSGELEGRRIDGVEMGYYFRETSAFGDGVLIPVWLISADTGRYIIDTANSEIHALPEVYSD